MILHKLIGIVAPLMIVLVSSIVYAADEEYDLKWDLTEGKRYKYNYEQHRSFSSSLTSIGPSTSQEKGGITIDCQGDKALLSISGKPVKTIRNGKDISQKGSYAPHQLMTNAQMLANGSLKGDYSTGQFQFTLDRMLPLPRKALKESQRIQYSTDEYSKKSNGGDRTDTYEYVLQEVRTVNGLECAEYHVSLKSTEDLKTGSKKMTMDSDCLFSIKKGFFVSVDTVIKRVQESEVPRPYKILSHTRLFVRLKSVDKKHRDINDFPLPDSFDIPSVRESVQIFDDMLDSGDNEP